MVFKLNEGVRYRGEESNEEIVSVYQEVYKDLEWQSEEFVDLNVEFDRLKFEKVEIERFLEEVNEQLEVFKVQLYEWK